MKKILLSLLTLFSLSAIAQDVIIKQNGDDIQCKLIEVGTDQIKYKRWTNQNGPVFVEERDDVFMIKYENGEKDVFGVKPVANNTTSANLSSVVTFPNLMYDRKSVSGLSANGTMIPLEQAQSIMGSDWNDFETYKGQRKKGKRLLVWGIICRSSSIPFTIAALTTAEIPFYAVASGLRIGSTPLLATGIVNMAKGQRGCKHLVKQHDASSLSFNPEFEFGVGLNAMSLRMNF